MSACDGLVAGASAGIAPALRAVDCVAANMTGAAFSRLFGAEGALAPALTILLTLYIAVFALSLLTGRATLGVSALTPRMLTLGLVLTFATSWVAYQGVLWNLAVSAPDQIAGVLMGVQGSATQIFADRIDIVFNAIGQVSQASGAGGQSAAAGADAGSFTPANLMWLGALLLLLGTVGVLLTARIALAVLLAVGPVFVVLALFQGTRGLTAGWLRGVVLTAVTPLFVVLGGGITLELLLPVVQALLGSTQGITGRGAMALFVIAATHVALMAMVLRVAGTMVAGWNVFGLGSASADTAGSASSPAMARAYADTQAAPSAAAATTDTRVRALQAASQPVALAPASGTAAAASQPRDRRTLVTHEQAAVPSNLAPLARHRARGIGSRFRAAPGPQTRQVTR